MLLKVNNRVVTGRKVKNLRQQGMLPASVYGPEIKARNIVLDLKDFKKVFKEAGYSTLLDLEYADNKKAKALVKEVQYDPVKEEYLHVSLYQVNMKKEIAAEVPLRVVGEALAVKNNLGLLLTPVSTIYVHCLPANLPPYLEVDVSKFDNIGDSVQISDLKLPEGVELDPEESPESVVAYISAPQKSIKQKKTKQIAKAAEAAAAAGVTAEGEEGAEGTAEGAEAATGAEAKSGEAKVAEAAKKPEEKKQEKK